MSFRMWVHKGFNAFTHLLREDEMVSANYPLPGLTLVESPMLSPVAAKTASLHLSELRFLIPMGDPSGETARQAAPGYRLVLEYPPEH